MSMVTDHWREQDKDIRDEDKQIESPGKLQLNMTVSCSSLILSI